MPLTRSKHSHSQLVHPATPSRNYFAEARRIATGTSPQLAEPEHVKALYSLLTRAQLKAAPLRLCSGCSEPFGKLELIACLACGSEFCKSNGCMDDHAEYCRPSTDGGKAVAA